MKIAVIQDYIEFNSVGNKGKLVLMTGDVGKVLEEGYLLNKNKKGYHIDFIKATVIASEDAPIAIYDISDLEPEHLGGKYENIYKRDCAHYTRKSNKADYVTNYCKTKNKYLCGTADCENCDLYLEEVKDGSQWGI